MLLPKARDTLGGEATDAQDDRFGTELTVDLLQGGSRAIRDELDRLHRRALSSFADSSSFPARRNRDPGIRTGAGAGMHS
jgi:hypothetical protein